MKNLIGNLYLKLVGWASEGEPPADISKYVLIAAPHTSNWDLPYMLALAFVYDIPVSWVGKHTLFRWPLGPLLRRLGGIPVFRGERRNAVQQLADRFRNSDRLVLAVAPEGTRGAAPHWKSGFYSIALAADVPIVMGFLDYRRKRGGFGPSLVPTGDVARDMDRFRSFYADKIGRIAASFGPVRLRSEALAGAG